MSFIPGLYKENGGDMVLLLVAPGIGIVVSLGETDNYTIGYFSKKWKSKFEVFLEDQTITTEEKEMLEVALKELNTEKSYMRLFKDFINDVKDIDSLFFVFKNQFKDNSGVSLLTSVKEDIKIPMISRYKVLGRTKETVWLELNIYGEIKNVELKNNFELNAFNKVF